MRRRTARALLAAGVTVAAAGSGALVGAVPASASPAGSASPVIKTVIDTNFAGYVTTGPWRFRSVAAAVTITRCRKAKNQNASARIALASNTLNQAAHIDLFCGGGRGSVRFGTTTHPEGMLRLAPRVGDDLKISVTRNPAACRDKFAATNTRTHRTKAISVRTPCKVVYRHAELGATLVDTSGTWKPPANNVRLWKLENTAIASYNGTRGTICGPWPAERHLAAPVITVRMIPSGLSDHCRDFSVLLKGRG